MASDIKARSKVVVPIEVVISFDGKPLMKALKHIELKSHPDPLHFLASQ
jgi:hypothetical protein